MASEMASDPVTTESAPTVRGLGPQTSAVAATAGPGNRVRPVYVFAGGFLVMFAVDLWRGATLDPGGPSVWQLAAGGAIAAAGGLLVLWCWRLFEVAGTGLMPDEPAARLVTTGPYGVSRNPMFGAFAAIFVGASLLLNAVWPLLALPAIIVVVTLTVIHREERYLRANFGDRYARYCERVPRWI
jgi:protein-S-isoprenylcysteine O-methyltransferase Ste14